MQWGEIRQALKKEFPPIDLGLITTWMQEEYENLLNLRPWAESIQTSQFTTVRPYSAGSVTLDGTQTVVGTDTEWSAAMDGRLLVIGGAGTGYMVMAVTSPTTLVVEVAPVEAPGTWGYSINQPWYVLAQTVDVPTLLRLPYQMPQPPCEPDRAMGAGAGIPIAWRLASDNPDGYRRVLLIPPPDDEYPITYVYTVRVGRFNGINTQDEPAPWISASAILDGVRARAGKPTARQDQAEAVHAMSQRDILRRGSVRARLPRNLLRGAYHDEGDW